MSQKYGKKVLQTYISWLSKKQIISVDFIGKNENSFVRECHQENKSYDLELALLAKLRISFVGECWKTQFWWWQEICISLNKVPESSLRVKEMLGNFWTQTMCPGNSKYWCYYLQCNLCTYIKVGKPEVLWRLWNEKINPCF